MCVRHSGTQHLGNAEILEGVRSGSLHQRAVDGLSILQIRADRIQSLGLIWSEPRAVPGDRLIERGAEFGRAEKRLPRQRIYTACDLRTASNLLNASHLIDGN